MEWMDGGGWMHNLQNAKSVFLKRFLYFCAMFRTKSHVTRAFDTFFHIIFSPFPPQIFL